MYEYCRMFVDAGFHVTFWPDNLYHDKAYAKPLQDLGIEVLYGGQLVGQFDQWIEKYGSYLTYVFLSRPHVSEKYIEAIKKHFSGKILYYGHDLHFARSEREYEVTRSQTTFEEIKYWRDLERRIWNVSDVIYYPADDEVDYIQKEMPKKAVRLISVYVYPNEEIEAARQRAGGARTEPPSLMFVAGFRHRPNVDAALWLAREILPRLKKRVPEFSTIMAGSFPPPEVTALGSDDLVVTGYVSDALLKRLYSSTSVIIAPLRFGGGVKGKILEALRYGVPIVTTTAGAQGMNGAEEYLGIADTAEDFVDRIVELLEDAKLGRKRALSGLDYIDSVYSYRSVVRHMATDIPELEVILQNRRVLQQWT